MAGIRVRVRVRFRVRVGIRDEGIYCVNNLFLFSRTSLEIIRFFLPGAIDESHSDKFKTAPSKEIVWHIKNAKYNTF